MVHEEVFDGDISFIIRDDLVCGIARLRFGLKELIAGSMSER